MHIAGRISIICCLLLTTIAFSIVILRMKASALQNPTAFSIPVFILFIGLPSLLSIFGAFAGATLIAGERQNETWETLLLCRVPAHQIVLIKLAARTLFCLIVALPAVAWWTMVLYKLAQFNPPTVEPQTRAILQWRAVIFATWSCAQVIGHLFPFVTFGMAVSSRCRRVNGALLFCAATFTVYGVLLWQMYASFGHRQVLDSSNPGLALQLFRWPMLPFLSGEYPTATDLLTKGWQTNLAVDLIWIIAVPLLLLVPTIAWSRLTRREPRRTRQPLAS
jgi:ABC-type Na+ efflux pump permease subunit